MNTNNQKGKEQYPIEFPAREDKRSHSPITDVVEHEIYPMDFASSYGNARRGSGVQVPCDNITEVVTTEIFPEK